MGKTERQQTREKIAQNNMKYIFSYITLALFILAPIGVGAESNGPLTAEFNPDPLFDHPNFMPGDSTGGSITAQNNTETEQDLYIRFIENDQTNDLGDAIQISVSDSGGSGIEDQSLNDWFADNEVFLTTFSGAEEVEFDVFALFEEESGNEYQRGFVDFDVCVGFSGGEEVCMDDDDGDTTTTTTINRAQFAPDSDEEGGGDEGENGEGDGEGGDPSPGGPGEPPALGSPTGAGGGTPALARVDTEGGGLGDAQEGEVDAEEEEDEEDERETQTAAAFFGLPDNLADAVMCISYFLLILLIIVLLTLPFDSMRRARELPRYERVTGRIVFMTSLALIATALALIIPALYCTFLALFITTVAGVLWFGFEDRRLSDLYY